MIGKPESLTPPSPGEAHMQNAHAAIQRQHAEDDAARAQAGTTTLIATRGFTLVTDEDPRGRIVQAGEEFTVSDFDLEHFLTIGQRKD